MSNSSIQEPGLGPSGEARADEAKLPYDPPRVVLVASSVRMLVAGFSGIYADVDAPPANQPTP